ncbi:signal peptidase I [Shewanella sp. TC10]|uniref:signal peptidase I n=1 Tax=Shewanella sp. TC10 TaxID=1419739 RepID=UPI00129EEBFC|nr:signal peptidase I [Shewanella sp. TC10]
MINKLAKFLKEYKSLLIFIALMSVFRSAVADWYTVPTGSMKPSILIGDRILANKMAYDVRIPFTHVSLYKTGDPARGDIIIFDSEAAGNRLVKRVVGVPGDTVALNNNQLVINHQSISYQEDVALTGKVSQKLELDGEPVSQLSSSQSSSSQLSSSLNSQDKIEDLLGVEHSIRVNTLGSKRSSFNEVTVPSGYYLVLGDNRDNSADSRVIGFVPRNEIIGRTKSVVMSFNYDNYYLPRQDRFFHSLVSG